MKPTAVRRLALALSALLSAACSVDVRETAVDLHRDANARLTEDAILWLGAGMSIAEWERTFGGDTEKCHAYYDLFFPGPEVVRRCERPH